MSDSAPKSWQRQPMDTDKSYRVFCVYRDMGRGRSLLKAAVEVYGEKGTKTDKKGTKRALVHIGRWSSAHNWVERVRAWDTHQEEIAQRAFEEEAEERSRLQAAAAVQVQTLALLRLLEVLPEADAKEALAAWRDGAKLERAIRGQASEVTGHQHHITPKIDPRTLSPATLRELAQKLESGND